MNTFGHNFINLFVLLFYCDIPYIYIFCHVNHFIFVPVGLKDFLLDSHSSTRRALRVNFSGLQVKLFLCLLVVVAQSCLTL